MFSALRHLTGSFDIVVVVVVPTHVEMLAPLLDAIHFLCFSVLFPFFYHNQKLPFWKAMALRWQVQAANPTARRQRCTSLPIRSIIGSPSK